MPSGLSKVIVLNRIPINRKYMQVLSDLQRPISILLGWIFQKVFSHNQVPVFSYNITANQHLYNFDPKLV